MQTSWEELFGILEPFFAAFKLRTYRKRDIILHEEDVPNGIYLIKSGYVKLYSYSPDGEELTRTILGPHDLFPVRWAFSEEPIDFYAESITPVSAWYAPRDKFLAFLTADTKRYMQFSHYIVHRMGTLFKRMEYFAFGNAYQKVAAILAALAKRFGKEEDGSRIIDVPLTQKDIASLVGIVRETVNMEMEKLRERGIITQEHQHIVVKDMKRLEAASHLVTEI